MAEQNGKIIPLAVPNLTGNERKYLNECIDTTFISSVGEFVTRLERMTAEETGARYAAATSAGTTALHMALLACGVKENEIVIIPSFTFIATANAVSHCYAIPWCIDIDFSSWTMSSSALRRALSEETIQKGAFCIHRKSGKRIAAILPVYTFGNIPDMDQICEIASERNIPVIADAAAAIGSLYKGRMLGGLADVTTISFNGNKTITAGGGGMVVSNNQEKIKFIHHISSTARVSTDYDHDMIGYNYRMTNVQAAIGCAQLERVNEFVKRKREIRDCYNKQFEHIEGIELFPSPEWGESACWFSGLVLNKIKYSSVKSICEQLKEKGIEARPFWKPVHMQKPYRGCFQSDLAVTEQVWDRVLTLPCSTGITNEELTYVCSELKKIIV